MHATITTTFAALFAAGILCQWLAWRVKLPAILFLLLTGILAGPVCGLFNADTLFGELLFPFVSLSVAVILFEGSLTLRYQEIAGLQRVVRNLVSFGMLLTWLITTIAARLALGFAWPICFLFGAITVVTGPTVIVPLLRTVRPKASVANILRWEGIVIDPIGATLAVLVFEFIVAGGIGSAFTHTLLTFGSLLLTGLALGSLAGYLFGRVLRNHWLPEYLHNVTALALVCLTFALSNLLRAESGLLAVTVMGLWLGNMKDINTEPILDFKESLSILLISVLFIVLASRMSLHEVRQLGWPALWVFLTIQFLARPLSVHLSARGSKLSWPERHLLAWIAPRGIVAAAISALFALQLEATGYPEARLIVPLTFLVIVGTVLLQSATAGMVARWLKVAEPDPKGFLIVGANPVARAIAQALEQKGFRALLVDTNWENIAKAKLAGLATFFGNPTSDHADRSLDLVGIGRMLALTPSRDMNTLAALHYRMELGSDAVYTLQSSLEKDATEKHRVSPRRRGTILFDPAVTYAQLSSTLARGGEIRSTRLTDSFNFGDYQEKNAGRIVPLFALSPKGRLHLFAETHTPRPEAGWTVISLFEPEAAGTPADRG